MFDVLLKGGTVVDGTGAVGYLADVAVSGDRIEALGRIDASTAKEVIDASGMIVSPGFIDLHTHSDASFLVDSLADSKLRQGVTLELAGNCGASFCAPLIGQAKEMFETRKLQSGNDLEPSWVDFGGYLDAVEQSGPVINYACHVGHGTIRSAVMGMESGIPTPEDLDRMVSLISESLDAVAMGFSTGLFYAPGSYSLPEEVIILAQPAADRGLIYSTHTRSNGSDSSGLLPAHAEAIEVGRRTGVRVQISHVKAVGSKMWGRASELIENMHRAVAEGLDVAGDQYPYSQSSGSLSMSMFPRWAQIGGRSATLDRLCDADQRQRIAMETEQAINNFGGPDRLRLTSFTPDRSLEGTSIADISDSWDTTVGEASLRLFEQSEVGIRNHSMSDEDVDVIASSDLIAVASDGNSLRDEGPLSSDQTHPRSYGTNARFIETMVGAKGLVSIEEAVRKMTGLPAQRMGLRHRGRIAPGYFADLAIFNPDSVRERTTFEDPHRYATGIDHVLVNGSFAVRDSKPTGAAPGRVIRDKFS